MRREAEPAGADAPVPIVTAPRLAPTEATRRWAAVLQHISEVDPLACPHCAGPMRIVACITQSAVIDHLLTSRRTRGASRGVRRRPSHPSRVARIHDPRRGQTADRPHLDRTRGRGAVGNSSRRAHDPDSNSYRGRRAAYRRPIR
jgi:hypothetical protein